MKISVSGITDVAQLPLWLNLKEVAAITGMSYNYLVNTAPRGTVFPAKKVAGQWRVHRRHFQEDQIERKFQ